MQTRRLLVLFLPLALIGCDRGVSDEDIRMASLSDVQSLLDRQEDGKFVRLVDPRAPRKFREGHIPGAVNVQIPKVESGDHPDLAGYSHLVVYGDDPGSAAARVMAKRLMTFKYGDVRMFEGGLQAWVESGRQLTVIAED